MKKKYINILLFIFVFFCFIYKVEALTGTVNVNDSLNMRNSPSSSGSFITGLYNNTVVNILDVNAGTGNGCDDSWYKISYGDYTGYACGTFININASTTGNTDDSYDRNNYKNSLSDGYVACYEDTGAITLRSSVGGARTSTKINCGDIVKIDEVVDTPSNTSCKYYYKVSTSSGSGYTCGYYINTTRLSSTANNYYKNNSNGDSISSYQSKLANLGFPSSYYPYLLEIHARHPKWNFVAEKINLNFDDVVDGESGNGASLLQRSGFDDGYLSTNSNTYNILSNKFSEYSGEPGWYNASKEAIAYFIDPRTYLNEKYIFAFETLEFRDNQSPSIISNYFSGKSLFDKPYKYYDDKDKDGNGYYSDGSTGRYNEDIVNASRSANVSALHVSSRILQEVGSSGSASSTGDAFTYCGDTYSGYYNFFNIGAYATDCATNIQHGLYNAKLNGWDTPYKSIKGGASFLTDKYISINQDTIYYEKFDVSTDNGNYTHQYQQNLGAPISEGGSTFKGYSNGLSSYFDTEITFTIPVYNNMPDYAVTAPKLGNPNNYLKSLTVNGKEVDNFSYDTYNYNVYLDSNVGSVNIGASTIVSTSSVSGNGNISINSNNQSNRIYVTSQNGKTRVYTINFTRQASDKITVREAMNNSGFKYNDNYIFGIDVGTNVSVLIGNIRSYNNSVSVSVKSSSGASKTNDIFKTGDTVSITGSDGTKEYKVLIYGDVNGDGKISAADYLQIKDSIMGKYNLNGVYLKAADTSRDGKITAADYLQVKDSIMGKYVIKQ